MVLNLELEERELGHVDVEHEVLGPDRVKAVVLNMFGLGLVSGVIWVSSNPHLHVWVDHFAAQRRFRDMLTAHDLNLHRPLGRQQSRRRQRRVLEVFHVSQEIGLEDKPTAAVVEEARAIEQVRLVFGLVVQCN